MDNEYRASGGAPGGSGKPGFTLAEFVEGIQKRLQEKPDALVGLTAKQPSVACQFRIAGQGGGDWYIEASDEGARVAWGVHPSPTVTWHSELGALHLAAKGQLDPKQPVRIEGDHLLLRDVLVAIAK